MDLNLGPSTYQLPMQMKWQWLWPLVQHGSAAGHQNACLSQGGTETGGWGELFNTPLVVVFLLHWLLCFSAPPGSLPSVTGPPPGTIPGMPPRPGLPPPGAPRMDLGVSRMHKFTCMCSHLCAYMSVRCTCKTPCVWR